MLCGLCSVQIGLYRDSRERKTGGRGPSARWLLVLFLSLHSACTLECKQPFQVASSCLSLLALGRRGTKNNQAGTSTCGAFTVVASGQAYLLPAGPSASGIPVQTFSDHPLPSLPQVMALSLLLLLEGAQEGGGCTMGLEALPGFIWGLLSRHVPAGPAGAAEFWGGLC